MQFFSPVIVLWTKAGKHLLVDEAMRKVCDRGNKVKKTGWNKG